MITKADIEKQERYYFLLGEIKRLSFLLTTLDVSVSQTTLDQYRSELMTLEHMGYGENSPFVLDSLKNNIIQLDYQIGKLYQTSSKFYDDVFQSDDVVTLGYNLSESIIIHYDNGVLTTIGTHVGGATIYDITDKQCIIHDIPDTISLKDNVTILGFATCKKEDLDKQFGSNYLTDSKIALNAILANTDGINATTSPSFQFKPLYLFNNENLCSYNEMLDEFKHLGFKIPEVIDVYVVNKDYDGFIAIDNELVTLQVEHNGLFNIKQICCFLYPLEVVTESADEYFWKTLPDGKLAAYLRYGLGEIAEFEDLSFFESNSIKIGSKFEIATDSNSEGYGVVKGFLGEGSGKYIRIPYKCPTCGHMLTETAPHTKYCNNVECDAQLFTKLNRLLSPIGLGVNISEVIINSLLDNGVITNISDFFSLTLIELTDVCGFSYDEANSILNSVELAKTKSLRHWLYSMSIAELTFGRCVDLHNYINKHYSIEKQRECLDLLTDTTFLWDLFGGEGLIIADSVKRNRDELDKILSYFNPVTCNTDIHYQLVAITGNILFSKKELESKLLERGVVLDSKVCNTTKLLLRGENPSPSKNEAATNLGIGCIDIELLDINKIVSICI